MVSIVNFSPLLFKNHSFEGRANFCIIESFIILGKPPASSDLLYMPVGVEFAMWCSLSSDDIQPQT